MVVHRILDFLPDSVKKPFHIIVDYYHSWNSAELFELKKTAHCRRFVLMGTPEHGNMGDQAIIYAEKQFLSDYFDLPVIEISKNCFRGNGGRIKRFLHTDDIILITGGGSLGSLWKNEHDHIVSLIERFPEHPLVIFPQTIHFEDSRDLKIESFRSVLQSHKNLLLCLREKNSYDFALAHRLLPEERIVLMPDFVLYLKNFSVSCSRKNSILVVERNDKEKLVQIRKYISLIWPNAEVEESNTVITHLRVTNQNREYELKRLMSKFQNAGLVITDRLHGMILSVISSTPCIAFDNSSRKVSGVYDFIQYLPYVNICTDGSDMGALYSSMAETSSCCYDNSNIMHYYDYLAWRIAQCANVGQRDEKTQGTI